MTRNSLWTEITMIGFLYLLGLTLLLLNIVGIYDLTFFNYLKEYLVYISIGVVGLSYILGVIFHKLLTMLFILFEPIFSKIFKTKKEGVKRNYQVNVDLWQFGSERLNREIDFQYSILVILSSLLIIIPLIGANLSFWISHNRFIKYFNLLIGITVIAFIMVLVVFVYQFKLFTVFRKIAEKVIKKKKRSTISATEDL